MIKRYITGALFVALLFFFATDLRAGNVSIITVQGAITPATAGFVKETVARCTENQSEALVILLDTPGGLDTSMRQIIQTIMDSNVPVIVYVHPSGARAASAGSIIMLASHIAAMTPGTNTGAAHPVRIGGGDKTDKTMADKVTKDAEAYARSIAARRNRNADYAAKFVVESSSVTAADALSKNIIDIVANTVDDLLAQADGKTVETGKGKRTLATRGAARTIIDMPFKYRFLSYLADPNIAYILMMIGIYGILFEIYSPGAIFPGIAGGISLILALYAFQTIPISFAGLSLIILAIIFFILEIKIISHGALAIAGVISLVIGSIMLIDSPSDFLSLSWTSIAVVAVLTGIFFFGVLSYAIKAQLSKVRTGREGIVGEKGTARSDISTSGTVLVHGELWQAQSDEPVEKGAQVIVVGTEGLTLKVRKTGGHA